ncbi:MAG: MFS transporter [Desulfurococcales archaeon]|nr:MFS transporter [Desulfurococcales archaeon]
MRRDYLAAGLMVVLAFAGTVAFRVSIPAVAFYTRGVLEASALGVGMLTSAFFAARAIFAVVSGGLADKYGYRVLYYSAAAFLLNAAVVNLYAVATSLPEVLAIRFAQGVLNGIAWVPVQVVLGRLVPESVRGRVYSVYFALGSLGGMAGNAIYAGLADAPITAVLAVSAASFAASSALVLATAVSVRGLELRPVRGGTKREIGGGVGEAGLAVGLLGVVPLVIIVLGSSMFNSVIRGDLIYMYMNEVFELSKEVVAGYVALSSLIALPMSYLLSWVSDRVDDATSLKISLGLVLAGALLVGSTWRELALIGLAMAYGGFSGVVPVTRRVAVTKFRLGGTAIGLVNASGNIGNVVGAALAGYLYDIVGAVVVGGVTLPTLIMASLVVASLTAAFLTAGFRKARE